jgi:hypothetical protein
MFPVQSPPARYAATMVTLNGKAILFGGDAENSVTGASDTWTWDGTNWSEITGLTLSPGPRVGASGGVLQGRFVLFGGLGLSDTWIWDGARWFQGPGLGPSMRAYATMAGPG